MKKLVEGLRHFQDNVSWERRELFERSAQGQMPQALLITCSDSRVLAETLMQADPGDLFVSRNAGISFRRLRRLAAKRPIFSTLSPLWASRIVCGHYRCGAVKALLDADATPEEDSPVSLWLTHALETRAVMGRDPPAPLTVRSW